MSADAFCWPARSALLLSAVVSYPVRCTVTPAAVPQDSTSLVHAADWLNWGYGSQNVYVPLGAALLVDVDPVEHAASRPGPM
jgi:hypothetical protein